MKLQDFSLPLTRAANSSTEPCVARTAIPPLPLLLIGAYRQRPAGAFDSLTRSFRRNALGILSYRRVGRLVRGRTATRVALYLILFTLRLLLRSH